MFIAHRGKVDNLVKENSKEAFINAVNDSKYQGFELDIRETLDHEIVVIHDFLFNGNLVSKQTYKKLANKGIIKLSEVLEIDTDKIILIEIKDFKMNLDILYKIIKKYKNKNIYVMSFNNEIIKRFMKYDLPVKCGILNYIFNRENSYNEYDFICLLNGVITDNIIEYFKKRKIILFSYGIISNYIEINKDIYYIIDNKC